jgi:hypothetical protein
MAILDQLGALMAANAGKKQPGQQPNPADPAADPPAKAMEVHIHNEAAKAPDVRVNVASPRMPDVKVDVKVDRQGPDRLEIKLPDVSVGEMVAGHTRELGNTVRSLQKQFEESQYRVLVTDDNGDPVGTRPATERERANLH